MKHRACLSLVTALALLLLHGCQTTTTVPSSGTAQNERDALAVFRQFQTASKDKDSAGMAACLTDDGSKSFFDLWASLMAAEGVQANPDEGFYTLTKDARPSTDSSDANTVRIIIPVALKRTSKIEAIVTGAPGAKWRIDKFTRFE